jgi:catechol 2,3-dioxygenase
MDLSTSLEPRLRASLWEIGLHSPQVERMSHFYRDALGYSFIEERGEFVGTAKGRRVRLVPGGAGVLAYAAYAVPSISYLISLQSRLETAGVDFVHGAFAGLDQAIRVPDPDGNIFIFGLAPPLTAQVWGETAAREARLQHVVLASANLGGLLEFAVNVLGFVITDRVIDENDGLRTAFMRCSAEHHSLAVFAAGQNRLDHHCYEAVQWDLIRDWGDHFSKYRIPVKWGPGRHGPGNNLFLFIHDPDGNWLEISAELESVGDDRMVGEWPHEERTLNSWGSAPLRS